MVQAILQNRKTVTRRLKNLDVVNNNIDDWEFLKLDTHENVLLAWFKNSDDEEYGFKFPYGKEAGDLMWVRETFTVHLNHNYNYKANYTDEVLETLKDTIGIKWKPSIHMPKKAARIWLKITDIRVERLQSISEEQALKEGVGIVRWGPEDPNDYEDYLDPKSVRCSPEESFESLWAKLNGYPSWDLNPWVWVIEFEKCDICYKTNKPCIHNCQGLCKESC